MENIPLVTSPWPQNIESLLSKVWWWWSGGNLKGDGSFDERGLKIEAVDWNEAIEAVAEDLILASRLSWRLTAVVGSGLLNKKTSSWNFVVFWSCLLFSDICLVDFFPEKIDNMLQGTGLAKRSKEKTQAFWLNSEDK